MKLLVIGAKGQVGRELMGQGQDHGFSMDGLDIEDLDITDALAVVMAIRKHGPGIVINAAAYTAVDQAETDSSGIFAVNCNGVANLARSCAEGDIPLIHISTDYVFDGESATPYQESDTPNPLNIYGKSKLAGEQEVRHLCRKYVILRTSWLFSSHGQNFVKTMLRLGENHETLHVINDQLGCPTPAEDLADVILRMSRYICSGANSVWGTYHYCGAGAVSWYGFAEEIFACARQYHPVVLKELFPITTEDYPLPAKRPAYSVLNCQQIRQVFGIKQLDWRTGLRKVIAGLSD